MPDFLRLEHGLLLVMSVYLSQLWWQWNKRRVKGWWQRVKEHLPVKRHPKSPKDCRPCWRGVHLESVRIKHAVTPWREVKSQRGRKKQYPTQGWACLNPACP